MARSIAARHRSLESKLPMFCNVLQGHAPRPPSQLVQSLPPVVSVKRLCIRHLAFRICPSPVAPPASFGQPDLRVVYNPRSYR